MAVTCNYIDCFIIIIISVDIYAVFFFFCLSFLNNILNYAMRCCFCFSEVKVEAVGRFKACGRCTGNIVSFCEDLLRQITGALTPRGWSVEVITDENDWAAMLSLSMENGLCGDGKKAILFAICCRKGGISTVTFIDRMSVLAATSADFSRVFSSSRRRKKNAVAKWSC